MAAWPREQRELPGVVADLDANDDLSGEGRAALGTKQEDRLGVARATLGWPLISVKRNSPS